jgi:hypothetical protein
MIWLKSITMGLTAVLTVAVLIMGVGWFAYLTRPAGVVFVALRLPAVVPPRQVSGWLILTALFLLGFGWELWRLGH